MKLHCSLALNLIGFSLAFSRRNPSMVDAATSLTGAAVVPSFFAQLEKIVTTAIMNVGMPKANITAS